MAFNCLVDKALERRGLYLYLLPVIDQTRKAIFEAMTIDGMPFLDFIPKELVKDINKSQMKITLINGSIIRFGGSDSWESHIGANALGIVYSEWSQSDENAYRYLRPMLTASGGFALFVTTPRGKNHAYDLFQRARNLDDWFTYHLTIDDTKHISLDDIAREQSEDETLSDDLVQQEYYCSFEYGASGQFYNEAINKMRLEHRLSLCAYDSRYPVHTAWDLGYNDPTCIIFFQYINGVVKIFDYIEKQREDLEYFVKLIKSKDYVYGTHVVPHDIKVHELGTGATRLEMAASLGLNLTVSKNLSIEDGINTVQNVLKRTWIDEPHCSRLIKCLENYRAQKNEKTNTYSRDPQHTWASHGSDAMRYLAISLDLLATSEFTAEELDKRYNQVRYGTQAFGPNSVFNTRR